MSRIDLSQIITAEVKLADAALTRAEEIKSACKARILSAIPESAQMNVAMAVTTYTAERLRGGTETEAEAASGLVDSDFATARAGHQWIADMQSACRILMSAPETDHRDDAAWPPLPEGIATLVSRF